MNPDLSPQDIRRISRAVNSVAPKRAAMKEWDARPLRPRFRLLRAAGIIMAASVAGVVFYMSVIGLHSSAPEALPPIETVRSAEDTELYREEWAEIERLLERGDDDEALRRLRRFVNTDGELRDSADILIRRLSPANP